MDSEKAFKRAFKGGGNDETPAIMKRKNPGDGRRERRRGIRKEEGQSLPLWCQTSANFTLKMDERKAFGAKHPEGFLVASLLYFVVAASASLSVCVRVHVCARALISQ